jgi:NagD protein
MAALIKEATGVSPFFVGKPNPYMMRSALNYLGAHSEETVMVGDRMDTDIVGAVSSGLDTVLVLTGVTQREEISRFPYQPTYVLESIGDIEL